MTHVMAKGANLPLTAAAVRAVLRWTVAPDTPDVDASALLLGAHGRVRSDVDFVFYNQPRHPSGLVRQLPKQTTGTTAWDAVEVDLARLPGDVDRVVLAGSADGPFPAVADLRVLLYDLAAGENGEPVAEFEVTDPGQVTALIAAEFYRRDGGWKFRAIGQGYATGLSGLATDYGITVDEDAAQPAPTAAEDEPDSYTLAPAAAPANPAPPSSAPTAPPSAPIGYGYPPPQQPQPPRQPGYGYPQQPAAAPVQPPQPFALPPQGPQFQPR